MKLGGVLLALVAGMALLPSVSAQEPAAGSGSSMPSPPAQAHVQLNGKEITVTYNSPSMRGRKIFGGLVPYGQVWRTGANPATMFKTSTDLQIGSAHVPAGTYTLFTLPSPEVWKLIINKQTGQWGLEYHQERDLARVDMEKKSLSQPQERMSISFENTHGNKTELHVRWDTTDVWVPIVAQ